MRRALPILTLVIVLALAAAGLADLGAPAAVLAQGPTPGMAAVGARVAAQYGCFNCHTTTGADLIGPSFLGLYGSAVTLGDGTVITADEDYIRRSILAAHEQIRQGFAPNIMPDYSGVLSNQEVEALVAYIRSLGAPAPGATPMPEATLLPGLQASGLQILVTILTNAGLIDQLQAAGPFTIFAPSDQAFATLPGGAQGFLGDAQALRELLLNHIVMGQTLTLAELEQAGSVTNLAGRELAITRQDDTVAVNGIPVLLPNLRAGSGIVHVINGFLTPLPEEIPTPIPSTELSALAQAGREQVRALGCTVCHTTTGETSIGPTFLGLYGSTVTLQDGTRVLADEGYLRRSIVAAHEQLVAGFPGLMPDYATLISPQELDAIVAFLRELGTAPTETPAPVSDRQLAEDLWEMAMDANYPINWAMPPGKGSLYQGQPPHGALLTTYVNPQAQQAIERLPGVMPEGAVILTENYDEQGELESYTLMAKRSGYYPSHGDWFWAQLGPDGEVTQAGKVPGCISCHGAVRSNDYIFTFPVGLISPEATTGTATPGVLPTATPLSPQATATPASPMQPSAPTATPDTETLLPYFPLPPFVTTPNACPCPPGSSGPTD
ncbi:MAG: fasciclin domain-containing protein [Anaerolineae bacterium]|jgi:uncharacterized surface protein with fasciclin (FAS1) repeats